jgi:hypothetical protein
MILQPLSERDEFTNKVTELCITDFCNVTLWRTFSFIRLVSLYDQLLQILTAEQYILIPNEAYVRCPTQHIHTRMSIVLRKVCPSHHH